MKTSAHRLLSDGTAIWLIAATLCGLVLRGAWLSQLAVEHYDEGVYASNLVFLEDEGDEFPGRALFAPPMMPLVIEWTTIVWRMFAATSPSWLPMLPGIVCGIALVPSAGWIARRWFGPAAGVAAAWLVALSEYHAFYSRTALTDAPLMLAWLWGVYWVSQSLERYELRPAVIAGVVTAVAWWTKYSGWLPLAIAVSGGVAATVMRPASERSWPKLLRTLAVMIGTAVILWLPVLWDCQSVGGYAAVAANHRGYVEPWSKWFASLVHQGQNIEWYVGAMTALGFVSAGLSGIVAERPADQRANDLAPSSPVRMPLVAILLAAALTIGLVSVVGVTLGLLLAGCLLAIAWGLGRWQRRELSSQEMIAACLLSAWFLGMLLATPRYHAYPRLIMPLWLAGCLGTAWLIEQDAASAWSAQVAMRLRVGVNRRGMAVVWGVFVVVVLFVSGTQAWEDRRTFSRAGDDIAAWLAAEHRAGSPPAVFVYGEPALFLSLRQRDVAAILRGDLAFAEAPPPTTCYLVAGLFAERDTNFREQWDQFGDRFDAVQTWPVQPSSLYLLDNISPAELRQDSADRTMSLTLYRLRSP